MKNQNIFYDPFGTKGDIKHHVRVMLENLNDDFKFIFEHFGQNFNTPDTKQLEDELAQKIEDYYENHTGFKFVDLNR